MESTEATPEAATTADEPRRLVRSRSNRMIAGVCGGMADYFRIDAALIRLGFVVLLFCGGAGIPIYLIAWLIIPLETEAVSLGERMISRLSNGNPPSAQG